MSTGQSRVLAQHMALATRGLCFLQTCRFGQMQGRSLQLANLFQTVRRPARSWHESPRIADLLHRQSASAFLAFFRVPADTREGVGGTDRAPLDRGEATFLLVGSVDVPSVRRCNARTAISAGTMLRPDSSCTEHGHVGTLARNTWLS